VPAKKLPPGDRPLKTLERILSKKGLGSRREARSWIAAGRAAVNGETVSDPDRWVDLELDRVTFDGEPLPERNPVYLLLHKPVGYLTTYRDPEKRPTIYDLLPETSGFVFSAGRLDYDTSGLLIVTSDAALAERITNPQHEIPKTYRVRTVPRLEEDALEWLRTGVDLTDGPTRPAAVRRVGDAEGSEIEIVLTEGRNRQVRRMVEAVAGKVAELARTAIGSITIGDLEPGATRELTREEIESLSSRACHPERSEGSGGAGNACGAGTL
jgi:23S rRNA pseudouridine2605 synthase